MARDPTYRPALPCGWFYPNNEIALELLAELQREVPPDHLLSGRDIETFAWREGATDDVLFRHAQAPERFTVVHLSWLGRTEINSDHPSVEFDGTFAGFLAEEERLYGLIRPEDA